MKHPLAQTLARLEKWLAQHRPRYRRALLPGARRPELAALERALGVPLPDELRALLAWHNGQGGEFVGTFEESWLLMDSAAIAATKQELEADRAATGWQRAWIPFLDNDQGDFLYLDTRRSGTPVRSFGLGQKKHPVVAPSLSAWLNDFVTAVERGDYREDPERGTFLRVNT